MLSILRASWRIDSLQRNRPDRILGRLSGFRINIRQWQKLPLEFHIVRIRAGADLHRDSCRARATRSSIRTCNNFPLLFQSYSINKQRPDAGHGKGDAAWLSPVWSHCKLHTQRRVELHPRALGGNDWLKRGSRKLPVRAKAWPGSCERLLCRSFVIHNDQLPAAQVLHYAAVHYYWNIKWHIHYPTLLSALFSHNLIFRPEHRNNNLVRWNAIVFRNTLFWHFG